MWPFWQPPTKPTTLLDRLDAALHEHHKQGKALLMDPRDTSFLGGQTLDERDEEAATINAIRSLPTHY